MVGLTERPDPRAETSGGSREIFSRGRSGVTVSNANAVRAPIGGITLPGTSLDGEAGAETPPDVQWCGESHIPRRVKR